MLIEAPSISYAGFFQGDALLCSHGRSDGGVATSGFHAKETEARDKDGSLSREKLKNLKALLQSSWEVTDFWSQLPVMH